LGLDGQADHETPHSGFSESYHGFRSFGQLLEKAQTRGLLQLELDEKSGGYIIKSYSHHQLSEHSSNRLLPFDDLQTASGHLFLWLVEMRFRFHK